MREPIAITRLHQIELTSHCDLRCVYCPNQTLKRPKVHISEEHFFRALAWVRHYVHVAKTQDEVNIAGIGESTLHPDFIAMLAATRGAVGPGVKITLATNGLSIAASPDLVAKMQPHNPRVFVSLHRPEKAGLAVSLLREAGLLAGVSMDPAVNANEWAGQVAWKVDAPGDMECMWLRDGRVMVMADGRITTCCLDATGCGVIGHINDPIGKAALAPYKLCRTCHQRLPEN